MPAVTTDLRHGVLYVTINNPPVNATSLAVRKGLMAAVDAAQQAKAVVLRCEGRSFIAGGDISEFDKPAQAPDLPDVVAAIEHCPAPWIALLHGTVLGGGLEVALGCSYRLAQTGTKFGLPEVSIGLVPGAGGTQRLPRLVGFALAAKMATTGKMIDAPTFRQAGGLERVVEDLESAVQEFLQALPPRPSPISTRPKPEVSPAELAEIRQQITASARGAKAGHENLKALLWATTHSFKEGQPLERALHLKLRGSAESRALRHAFFAERAAAKPAGVLGASPRPIFDVAIIGGGLMGAGIATACLLAGFSVRLLETDAESVQAGLARINALLDGAVNKGKLTAKARAALQLSGSASVEDLAPVDIAIEAVFEDAELKRQVFRQLAGVVSEHAILASNTSYLDPHVIFEGLANPSRCLGLHFFSPAHVMKLVEVIALDSSGPDTLATGFAFAKRLGKTPVYSGVCDGFIGNRMLSAYRRAADYMLADGAMPAQIDAAMRGFGMPMGPYELQDLTGLQIAYANRQRQAATRPPKERYVKIADELVEKGRLGQRSAKGWYRYAQSRQPLEDPEVTQIIQSHARRSLSFSDEEIVARLMAALVNEGQRILDEGIARSAGDIDVVQMLGYNFPRWRGGPMHYGSTQPDMADKVAALAAQSPHSWVLADKFKG